MRICSPLVFGPGEHVGEILVEDVEARLLAARGRCARTGRPSATPIPSGSSSSLTMIVTRAASRRRSGRGSRTTSRARRAARCRTGRRGCRAGCRRSCRAAAISWRIAASLGIVRTIGHVRDQRIALEVHLRDEPLHPAGARDRIVDVRGPPVVDAVAPRIGPGLDRPVDVVAVAVGEHAAAAAEVRIDRRDVACPSCAGSGRPRWPATPRPAHSARRVRISSSTWPWTTIRSPIGRPSFA